MNHPSITVVIDGNTYTLQADDLQGMRDMPGSDRSQLIKLLEVLKAQHEKSQRLVQDALNKQTLESAAPAMGNPSATSSGPAPARERMSKGDIDELMTRLIMEERQQQKQGLQSGTIYKFIAVVVGVIIVLSLI